MPLPSGAARRAALFVLPLSVSLLLVCLALTGCGRSATEDDGSTTAPDVQPEDLILASTTSTQDSGLFDELIPAFEDAHPECQVKVLAVGTGEALALGESKDADVLLVHARDAEEEFIADGFGIERADVMYNDFVIVGPADDPAGVSKAAHAAEALALISETGSTFVSRGDDSGTHKKEKRLWESAGIASEGDWYLSAGQGMGEVLKMAAEKQAHTLTDRATYLNLRDTFDLEILFDGDEALKNQYGVMTVTDAANPDGAQAFFDWITGEEGQDVIRGYGVEEFGQSLFFPNATGSASM